MPFRFRGAGRGGVLVFGSSSIFSMRSSIVQMVGIRLAGFGGGRGFSDWRLFGDGASFVGDF